MNAFQNPLIRIIASIAVGLLLILYPNAALPTILLIIGILIGLPSLYALLIYLLSEDRNKLPRFILSDVAVRLYAYAVSRLVYRHYGICFGWSAGIDRSLSNTLSADT